MAIDPRIPLAVQVAQVPARIPDPFERAAKIMSLRDMMQRRELQAQQTETMAEYRRSLIEQKEREAEQARLKQESVDKWKGLWATGRTPTPQETFGILGPDGIKVVTELEDLETRRIANENTRLGWVSNAANAVLENPTGFNLRFHANDLFNRKALTREQYEDLISLDVENPATIVKLEGMRDRTRDVKQQSDEALARTIQKDVILKSASEAASAQAEAELKGLSVKDARRAFNAIKLAGALEHSPEAFNAEYDKLPPEERAWFSGAPTPDAIRLRGLPLSTRTAETRLRAGGMMEPPPEDVQDWQLRLRSTAPPRQPQLLTPEEEAQRTRIAIAGATGREAVKPPTEGERKVLGYHDMMEQATNVLERPRADAAGKPLPSLEQMVQNLPRLEQQRLKYAPNDLQTAEGQQYNQALRQFTAARLRKESGATISPSEIEESIKTYFPWPGDKAPVLKQKREARQALMRSFQTESGRAWQQRQEGKGAAPPPGGRYAPGSNPMGLNF